MRVRWLISGAVGLVALAMAWAGCSASGGGSELDDTVPGGGQGGAGGEELPCGIDCATIQTDACHVATCDMALLQCAVVPAEDGLECDDGLFCTIEDSCQNGTCAGSGENDCQLEAGPCQAVVCVEESKTCQTMTEPNGTGCSATDPCIVGAHCTNGLCLGAINDCFLAPTPDQCHVAVCNSSSGDCEPVVGNNGFPCVDYADLCMVGGSCSAGVCAGAVNPKDCSHVADDCNAGTCNSETGECLANPTNEAGACDDAKGCTASDACTAGTCDGPTIAVCANDDNCCAAGCTSADDNDCQKILLFGDDTNTAGWNTFRAALTAAGRTWDERDYVLTPMVPDAATLANYDTLIMFDDSYTDFADGTHQAIVDWLSAGPDRNAFFTSRDYLIDWVFGGTNVQQLALYNLIHMPYLAGSAGLAVERVDGVVDDPISGDFAFPNGLLLTKTSFSSGDYMDETNLSGATHAGFYMGGSGAGLNHSALAYYQTANYQVVYLSPNFATGLANQKQRNRLMINILNWFKQPPT